MNVVGVVAVVIEDVGVVVEVIVSAEVCSGAGIDQAFPERVALFDMVVETIAVGCAEGGFVSRDEYVRFDVCCELVVEPLLIDPVYEVECISGVLIEQRRSFNIW